MKDAIKIPAKLEKFLREAKAKYELVKHRTVYTAYDAAQTLKVDLGSVAKTLVVQLDRDLALAVIPADRNLDFGKLKKVINTQRKQAGLTAVKKVNLVTERSIAGKVTKKPGAVVPFGQIYKLPTYVDKTLLNEPRVVLNAGSFETSLVMSGSSYGKLAQAAVCQCSKKRSA